MVGWQRAVSSGEPANSYSDMANTTERRRQKLTPEGMEEILSNGDEDDVEEDEIIEFQQKPPELARTAEHDRDEPSQNGNMNGSGYGDLLPHQQEDKTKAQHGSAIGEKKGLYCETGCVLLAFFGLGIAFSIAGPTLLDLACHTKSKLENMSYIFTSLSVGYLTGSMVGGWLCDKFNKLCVMSLSCLVTTLFMWVSPLPTNLYALMVLISAMAFAGGALNTGGNVLTLELWQEKSRPYMQLLHFTFAAGAFISPLLVKPFLLPVPAPDPLTNASLPCNHSGYGDMLPATWGYWIGSLPLLVSGVGFLVFTCFKGCSTRHIRIQKYITDEIYAKSKVFKYSSLSLFFLFVFLQGGTEITYGGYIFAFGTKTMSKDNSAYLTSVFWGSFAIGRFLSIPISKCVTPSRMLIFDMLGCFIGSSILISQFSGGCSTSAHTQLWLGTVLLGLAMASVFPSAISLAEMYIGLSGKTASVLIVGACFGNMIVPLSVGILFVRVGPCVLMYCSFVITLLITVVYVSIDILRRRCGDGQTGVVHYYRKSTHAQTQQVSNKRPRKDKGLRLLQYSVRCGHGEPEKHM